LLIERILIVGLGSIGRRHLRIARELMPDADIRVLRHQKTTEAPEFSDGYFFSLAEAIAFMPQIAIIANPSPFHISIAQGLAEAGIHMLIEKPLSNSLDGVKHLLETCHAKDVVLQMGYNLRFLQSLNRFREFICEGRAGKILSVRCEAGQYLPSWRIGSDYRHGVSAKKELGGGALLEFSHELDYLRWIFGDIAWVKATLSHQSNLEINVEDSAHLTLGFAGLENMHQLIGAVSLDFIRHDTTRQCTAIGDKGSLRWNGLTGVVECFAVDGVDWSELFRHQHHRDDSYIAEWKSFIASIVNKNTPAITGNDGLKVLQIVEACRDSALNSGKIMEINYV
jgi:predicted dehydrogenase